MAGIPYVGADQANPNDLTNRGYIDRLLAANMTQPQIDAMISAAYANYVLRTYVDTQDGLNATKTFIDAGDATRLKLAQVGANNGAAPLLSNGRIASSRVSAPSTQRWPKPYYAPSSYYTGSVTASTSEVVLYTYSLPDPGGVYKLFVTGLMDVFSNVDGEYGVVRVRVGSASGPVIAGAYGLSESYVGGTLTTLATPGSSTYNVPSWASSVDVVCIGGGGGGGDGYVAFFVSWYGQGGNPGNWATGTLVRGTNLPATLTAVVGAAGARNTAGGNSSVSGAGITTITGTGGAGAGRTDNYGGGTAAPQVFNGNTYTPGAGGSAPGVAGAAPGGGGGGGSPPGSGQGVPGGSGGIWLLAYPTPTTPTGPATIIPTPMNAQAPLAGAQTLYVTLQRSGTASTQTATQGIAPKLSVIPIPASGTPASPPALAPGHVAANMIGFNQVELSVYGVSGQPASTDVPTVCAGIAATGAKWIRLSVFWSQIQPSNATTFVWTQMDYAVAQAKAAGLSVLLAVAGQQQFPSWASTTTQYANFCTTLAQRYGPTGTNAVRAWEIGNEQNTQTFWSPVSASNYVTFLKAAYSAIKAVDSGSTVMCGGFAADQTFSSTLVSPSDYLTQMYAAGAHGYMDAVAYHPYSYNESTFVPEEPLLAEVGMAFIPSLRTIMTNNGDGALPIWFTEFGFSTQPSGNTTGQSVSPSLQASWLVEQIANLVSYSPIGPMFIYNYRDTTSDDGASNFNNGYGMVTYNFTAKPALAAVKGVIG